MTKQIVLELFTLLPILKFLGYTFFTSGLIRTMPSGNIAPLIFELLSSSPLFVLSSACSLLYLVCSLKMSVKMLRCVGFLEKFCRPVNIPPDYTLEKVEDAFLLKFPELQATDSVLIQVCRQLPLSLSFFCFLIFA